MKVTKTEATKARGRGSRISWAKALVSVLQTVIGGFFLIAGAMKLAHAGPDIAIFAEAGMPAWALTLAGVVNVAGGGGMLLGLRQRSFVSPSSALIAAYLVFAIYVALLNANPRDAAQLAVMLLLSVVVGVARRPGASGVFAAGKESA